METKDLLEVKNKGIMPEWFPTPMQAVIFRNWGMISKEKLAKVLKTTPENIEIEAKRMGLEEQGDVSEWLKKGYITIIRSNWHLLSYEQLLELLDWDAERLSLALKEDDFLWVKLGHFKPGCETVTYRELTQDEIKKTEDLKRSVESIKNEVDEAKCKKPFDFWSGEENKISPKAAKKEQVALNSDWACINTTKDTVVDEMLNRFKKHMKKLWNIDFLGNKAENCIEISYIPGAEEEYHEIHICDNKIEIKAGGSSGALRGLYRIEDLSKANGGAFFDKKTYVRKPRIKTRFLYPFSALYESALDVDSRVWCADELLEKYAETGVNGIWLQGVLYRLTKFPFAPNMSDGYEKRQENLRDFVSRAKMYGIKVYLYLNEPRSMPKSFFEKYPHLRGSSDKFSTAMCTQQAEVKEYLKNSVEELCRAVPDLGGFFTITMSENITHCQSRPDQFTEVCPTCADTPAWKLSSEVNSLIAEGAHRVNPSILVVAWDWGWHSGFDFDFETKEDCIKNMPEDVAVMCQRECYIKFVRGGVEGSVLDYAISVDGVSEESMQTWDWAKQNGHETAAKIQVNCTWECSTTPYLPVYRSLIGQLESLMSLDVKHVMLGWTLGGYPSPSIKVISEAFFEENGEKEIDYNFALRSLYGSHWQDVKEATDKFCDAFSEFPFDIEVAYKAPQNGGASNLLYHKPTGYTATMTCYTYDDIETWRSIYPEDVFENQFKIISEGWKVGMAKLENAPEDIRDIAFVSYSLFRASYNQIRFVRLRNMFLENETDEIKNQILDVVTEERWLAGEIYKIMRRRPEIGFEAANHYYYSADNVLEKIVNCDYLVKYYNEK